MRVSTQTAAIYSAMKQHGGWQSTTEIAERTRLTQTTVRNICRKLTNRKVLECYSHLYPKRYGLANTDEVAAILINEATAILESSQH